MQKAVVQFHRVEPHAVAQRMYVQFAHALGLVSGPGKLSGHGVRVAPGLSVLITHAAMVFLAQPGVERRARGDARGAGGIGVREANAARGEIVQIGREHVGMPVDSEAIASELVCHDEKDVRPIHTYHLNGIVTYSWPGRNPFFSFLALYCADHHAFDEVFLDKWIYAQNGHGGNHGCGVFDGLF